MLYCDAVEGRVGFKAVVIEQLSRMRRGGFGVSAVSVGTFVRRSWRFGSLASHCEPVFLDARPAHTVHLHARREST